MDNPDKASYLIVVTGSFMSGRSSFVHSITTQKSDLDVPSVQWISINGGKIELDNAVIYVMVAPNNRRFDFLLDIDLVLGCIVIMDSTAPEVFGEAKSILETLRAYAGVPIVLAANFQDHPYAWDVETLRIALRVQPEIPIIPCIATDKDSVKNVLLVLCDEVLKDIVETTDE